VQSMLSTFCAWVISDLQNSQIHLPSSIWTNRFIINQNYQILRLIT